MVGVFFSMKTKKKEDISYEQSNVEAGKKVIKNALYCLQNSLSARNFVGLNAKDYTCYLENPATKNDSEKEFYKLRDIIFEALSEKTIRFFQENVKQISVTLDKVTGKSFSEALILASTNPQYDKRLLIELPVQHMKTTCAWQKHVLRIFCSCSTLVVFMY